MLPMDRKIKQVKDERIVFRIQSEYMEELVKRAQENGITPHMFARILVQEALREKDDREVLERLDLIEDRLDELRSDIMHFIKEIFIGLGCFNEGEVKKLIPKKS
jgi:hypothetical protein